MYVCVYVSVKGQKESENISNVFYIKYKSIYSCKGSIYHTLICVPMYIAEYSALSAFEDSN